MLFLFRKLWMDARRRGPGAAAGRATRWLLRQLTLPVRKQQAVHQARLAATRPRQRDEVVFIADTLTTRQIKLAYALRHIGWTVHLLYRNKPGFDTAEYFNTARPFADEWDALRLAATESPAAFHVFSCWNFRVAATLIQYKPGPVVFDDYDVLTGMVKDELLDSQYPGQAPLERYCLTHADGLCCRGLHTQYLKQTIGLRLPKRLLFPDYCWGRFAERPKLTDGIHIAYVGSLELDPASPMGFQYELAALLARQKIHFHIFPSIGRQCEELRRLMAQALPGEAAYIHIHDTLSPTQLIEQLSHYHYGLIISSTKVDYHDDHSTYTGPMHKYVTANKVFDYMDARLFILAQEGCWLRHLLGRYGHGAIVRSLQDIITHCSLRPATETTLPKSLEVSAHARQLAGFYLSLK